jgi:hypothetical protein
METLRIAGIVVAVLFLIAFVGIVLYPVLLVLSYGLRILISIALVVALAVGIGWIIGKFSRSRHHA